MTWLATGFEHAVGWMVDGLWHFVAPMSVRVCLWVLIVALIARWLPKNTWPELRWALWLLVLLRLMVPPAWVPALPLDALPAMPWPAVALPAVALPAVALPAVAFPDVTPNQPAAEKVEAIAIPGWLPPTIITTVTTVTAPSPAAPGNAPSAAAIDFAPSDADRVERWAEITAVVWFVGAALFLTLAVLSHRRTVTGWRRPGHRQIPDWLAAMMRQEADRIGLRRLPEVVFSPRVSTPLVTGLLRPTLFLPRDLLDDLPRRYLGPVLLHELAHLRRRDPWIAAICLLIHAAYWFHPAVWYARRRVSVLTEPCCDRTVARALQNEVADYRRALLFFAQQQFLAPPRGPGLAFLRHAFLGPESMLMLRLRLLEDTFERTWLRRAATSAALLLLLLASLPAARVAGRTVAHVGELIERPPGCLTLRYLVLQRLAQAATEPDSTMPSNQEKP